MQRMQVTSEPPEKVSFSFSDFSSYACLSEQFSIFKEYENYSEFADFKKNLKQKIENGKFKDGENEIFKKLENIAENRRKLATDVLRVAFWFYFKLNGLSDKVLEDGGFTRLDVLKGMQEIENILTNC